MPVCQQSRLLHLIANHVDQGISLDTTFSEDASNFRSLFNKSYNVNVTGAQVLTSLFVPLLIRSPYARLVFLTSSNASLSAVSEGLIPAWTPEPEDGWPKGEIAAIQSYACSKAAVNMCMLTWHHMLKYDRVKTFAVNPGLLATHLGGQTPASMRELGAEDPAVAGELIRKVVEGERDADVGKIITQHGVQEW
jgi:NAD(P)-dependent dehydrogenase (short-subunit alcohol dehydrogenase family)